MHVLLPLLAACSGGPDDESGTPASWDCDSVSDSPVDTSADPDQDADCTTLTCFQACGIDIVVTDPVVAEGFAGTCPTALSTRRVAWHGDEAIAVDGRALVRYDANLDEIDRLDPLPSPLGASLSGDLAFLPSASGGVSIVDLARGLAPVGWWAPALDSGVGLEGVSRSRVVLRTTAGMSIVDVTDPLAPVELGCAPWGEEPWLVGVSEDFAVAALPDGAHLFDLAGDVPVTLGTVPLTEEGGVAIWQDRAAVWEDFRTVVLYRLSSGAAPVEIARREDDTRVQYSLWDAVVAGGLALHGGLDDDESWAMDLADSDLALYSTPGDDAGASGCVERYTNADDGAQLDLVPLWHPEERYDPGAIELGCPVGHDLSDPPLGGEREPDGDRLLVYDQGSWRLLDLVSRADNPLVDLAADHGYWLGDSAFGFTKTEGSDWGIPLVSTVTRTDTAGVESDVVSSPGPFVALAQVGGALWVLSEPIVRDYGDPEPAITDRVLWTLGATGAASSVALPVGAAPLDMVSGGGLAWVFDDAGEVLIYDDSGALTATCALPDGIGEGQRVASALGAFFVDAAGLPTLVSPGCAVARLAEEAPAWTMVGADERWLYATEAWAPGPGFTTVQELLALNPETLEVAGRLPTWREPRVVGGEPMAVLEQTLLVVERP